ncbi:hypothetical protein [Streptomyces erythrochromogenes]|uniref:hypothetical protein n=1 Tax=Streptomyces erythrochromogenes TaxID=285574 RepID=UPI0002FF9D2C
MPHRTPPTALASGSAKTVERLRVLGEDFTALHSALRGDRLVAGTVSLPALATRYANAQGLAASSLSLLLGLAEEPYAHGTADGRAAVKDLGRLAKAAAETTAQIANAAALAAEDHRFDGHPEPTQPRRAWKAATLDKYLAAAAAFIQYTPDTCQSAADFSESAARHAELSVLPGQGLSGTEEKSHPRAAAPVTLTPTQQKALRFIDGHRVEVYEAFTSRVGRRRVRTGAADRIPIQTVDALFAKRLIQRDTGTSRYAGQRLHLTEAGRDALQSLGPAPVPAPAPSPVRAASRAR